MKNQAKSDYFTFLLHSHFTTKIWKVWIIEYFFKGENFALIFFYEEIYTYLGWKMLHMQLA
jgi:hypothetical protein